MPEAEVGLEKFLESGKGVPPPFARGGVLLRPCIWGGEKKEPIGLTKPGMTSEAKKVGLGRRSIKLAAKKIKSSQPLGAGEGRPPPGNEPYFF